PEHGEARDGPGESSRRGGDEVDRERDEEQALASEPIREPAEEQRARYRAGKVRAARQPDLGIGEVKLRAFLQRARDRAGQRHLQAIENPGDPKRNDDEGVETAPWQP